MTPSLSLNEAWGNDAIMVRHVALRSFRNYDHLGLDLGPGFNVFAGANAQGKTNLLEAIYLVSTGRLLRGQKDGEAITNGHAQASVVLTVAPPLAELSMTLAVGVRKRAALNGLGLTRAADLLGRLPSVCVSTEDLSIARGEPADRRLFLDLELSTLYPAYLRHLTVYKRALEHRNALLRQAQEETVIPDAFAPWESQMASHGAAIRSVRETYIRALDQTASETHSELSPGETLSVGYAPRDEAEDEAELLAAFESSRSSEIRRGSTQTGPHRDEMFLAIDGREVRLYGSQGQQRSAIISLKCASLKLAAFETGRLPLLLLDDVFSDLDEHRRQALVELVVNTAGQVILTCTESSAAGPKILELAQVFNVNAGTVQLA